MNEKPIRSFELDISKVETLDDVKKVLDLLQIRIETDHPSYEKLKNYFTTEVVPLGYAQLLNVVGEEKINKMSYDEMIEKINALQNEMKNNEETN